MSKKIAQIRDSRGYHVATILDNMGYAVDRFAYAYDTPHHEGFERAGYDIGTRIRDDHTYTVEAR